MLVHIPAILKFTRTAGDINVIAVSDVEPDILQNCPTDKNLFLDGEQFCRISGAQAVHAIHLYLRRPVKTTANLLKNM